MRSSLLPWQLVEVSAANPNLQDCGCLGQARLHCHPWLQILSLISPQSLFLPSFLFFWGASTIDCKIKISGLCTRELFRTVKKLRWALFPTTLTLLSYLKHHKTTVALTCGITWEQLVQVAVCVAVPGCPCSEWIQTTKDKGLWVCRAEKGVW